MQYHGVRAVLDLEACMNFSGAGANAMTALLERAKIDRVAVTAEVWRVVKQFDRELADIIENSDIEIIECDDEIYSSTENIVNLIILSGVRMSKVVTDKTPSLGLVHCAKDGTIPPCVLVTGDFGPHSSSMERICQAIGLPVVRIDNYL